MHAYRSAYINPDRNSFCIGGSISSIDLPIMINQTTPISMELLRQDLDTQETDTLSISSSMLRKARKTALANLKHSHSPSQPLTLKFPVKKTGLYTIRQIIDESKLEVRPKRSEAVVVQCPQAKVLPTSGNKCRGDLSDIGFEVIGTPPLRVKYRKVVGATVTESSFQSIQPDDFTSPMARQQQALATKDELADASWARPRRIVVPVNETLSNAGSYWYAVDEVLDALGNSVSYESQSEDYMPGKTSKIPDTQQIFTVHDRPLVSLREHDTQTPLKVAKGEKEVLPLRFRSYSALSPIPDTSHTVEYEFTPSESLLKDGEHNPAASVRKTHTFKSSNDRFVIGDSGLYSLVGVSTPFCSGEVREPAAVMLQNPPMPDVDFSRSDIKDKCHENTVGMRLALSLIGSPPFRVSYMQQRKGKTSDPITVTIDGLRGTIDLQPDAAGDYTWKFTQISDRYYKAVNLPHPQPTFEMSVKPAASAKFAQKDTLKTLYALRPQCLNETITLPVTLGGEGPWNLKYEIIRPGGKRTKFSREGIAEERFEIETGVLDVGGEYTVSLTSVQAGGCAEDVNEQFSFSVRYQKPRAGFGLIEGKRSINTLEGKKLGLPVRLTGDYPWMVHVKDGEGVIEKKMLESENSRIEAGKKGVYEILGVSDGWCEGEVDMEADKFEVAWIERPSVKVLSEPRITEVGGGKYTKEPVCEGYDDSFEVVFSGTSFFLLPSSSSPCTPTPSLQTNPIIISWQRQSPLRTHLRRTRLPNQLPQIHAQEIHPRRFRECDHPTRNHKSGILRISSHRTE